MGKSKGRASSSGLAASLLPEAHGAIPAVGFGGYHGASRVDPAALLLSPSDDSDASVSPPPDVDAEVRQHLRRLGRKDPTTKLKALSTLSMLFAQKPADQVVQMVPQWAFEYKRLLLDYNRDVRRATNDAMSSLVTAVKKGVAPHLKSLMGPWWFSQFDPAAEVAQAARRSFEAAFPQSDRRLGALMLCVKETFVYLNENLKLTTQALSDKVTPTDELEDMYQRVISSSLLAMATLIDILLGVQLQSSSTESKSHSKVRSATLSSAEAALSMHKYFIDFLKSKSAAIRSATYTLLTSYIKYVPHVFNEEAMKILSPTLLGVFNEKDPLCHSAMWDAVLVFSRKFPEAWSYCNIHKVVLNRFWHFLQNGCYGSKQTSYPLIVQFLDVIPSKEVATEKFVFEFLQNLWAGRNQRHLSAADSLAFFIAFKQSFLWLLKKVPRNSVRDSSDNIHNRLITNVLVKIVWHDYLQLSLSKNLDAIPGLLSEEAITDDHQLSQKKSLLVANVRLPIYYYQDLGKCIVEILDEISVAESHLLGVACESLLRDYLDIVHQGEKLSKFQDHVDQLASFFSSLDLLVVQNGRTWPLENLARPLVVHSLPAIKSMDSPSLIKLLLNLVEIFGPAHLFLKYSEKNDDKSYVEPYLNVFNTDFVPWCLDGKDITCSSKIDLLLSLIQEECFFDQWCLIMKYIIAKPKRAVDDKISHTNDQFELLTLILQKVRERIAGGKLRNFQRSGSLPEHWRHDLLDSVAVSVFCDLPATDSHVHFLCAALGGSSQDDQVCFLSAEAVCKIRESILKSLASVLITSTFEWTKSAHFLLLPADREHFKLLGEQSLSANFEMAQFAFQVFERSLFARRIHEEDSVFSHILAALFIIEWECSMALTLGEENDLKEEINVEALKANLAEHIHDFRQSLIPSFWKDLHSGTLNRLADILAQSVRYAVFETRDLGIDRTAALCSEWVVDMLRLICLDHIKLQSFFDILLSEGEYWPLWVKPSVQNGHTSVKIQCEPLATGETETGVFSGFVEFEDHSGINNALNASPNELNGRLVHVEERRPNCVFPQGGTTDYFTGEHEAREVDAPAKNHEVHQQAPSPPIPEEEPVEEAPKTYASTESTLQAETEVQNSGETFVSVVEKSNDTHHVASVLEDEEFLLERAERAKLEADFEKARETMKDQRRLNWGDNATELFWKICNNKIDSIPKAEREWTDNTIIRDISLEIFYRTKVAYSSKQLFNKWRNMNKAPPKKKETNKAHGKKKEEDHMPLTTACEESEDDLQHLSKELEQLKINNKEDKEKYLKQYAAVCEEKQAVCEEKQMLIEKITHLEAQLNKTEALRRGMLNQILELKGSIRVFCRVRPSLKEDESHTKSLLSFPRTGQFVGRRVYLEHQGVKVSFTCDRVFDPSDSQEMIFREISELVQSALDGKKVCIFAYGQTGSGKTYTMLGEDGDCTKGIIPRALEKIFETAESRESHGSVHTIKISMIEIYNGNTRNLSSVDQAEVKTTAEALEALKKALGKRSVAKTMRNDKSSRSHFIFELSIYSYDKEKNVSEGVLSIIDLAGSEQPETNASEELKNEATEINKSLLSLGIMINAIESGLAYINHRDSTLTKELKSSLAKDTKVLMFINVAPEEACADETNATFEFAARIKSCTKTVIHEKMVFKSPGVSRASCGKDASVLKFLSRNNTRIINRQGPSFRKNFDVPPSCKKRKMYTND